MTQTGQTGGYGTASRERPGMVTAAAIVLIVIGALGTIGGLLGVVGGTLALGDSLYMIIVLAGLLVAILALVAGIGILTGKTWGRSLGIGVSVAAILLSLVSFFVTQSLVSQIEEASGVQGLGGGALTGGVVGIVIAVLIYGFVIWALTKEKDYFAA